MEIILKQFMKEIRSFRSETIGKLSSLQQDVSTIKKSVQRIEENQPQDVWALLDRIDKKLEKRLDESDSGIAALNKRVFALESELERLSKQ